MPSFADLSEEPDPRLLPCLDQPGIDDRPLTREQYAWRRDGVSLLTGFLPDPLMEKYAARRAQMELPGGWSSPVPYLWVPELREIALYPPLMEHMRELIGEDLMLHLCLTGWVSTERDWHQDDYLNPPFVNGWYAAVWMALDDIDPDSGPFQYIPGSHRWPLLRGEKVRAFMSPEELVPFDHWPSRSERVVTPAIEAEIKKRGSPIRSFGAKRGDVLIWHSRSMHRGSKPKAPGTMRKALTYHGRSPGSAGVAVEV